MNNYARVRTLFTMVLIIAILVSPTASAADQSCDQGAIIGAPHPCQSTKRVCCNPTWTPFDNALKAARNHRITFTGAHF